jgi:LPXTG-motif cell wall-anchored protein
VKASLPRGYSGALPQTDTAATLQLVMGLLALAMAAAVYRLGRA